MNALNISLHEFATQREIRKKIPLYPEWHDFEERKRELQQMNLSRCEYDRAIKDLATEYNL
jgi:hypothetical protein